MSGTQAEPSAGLQSGADAMVHFISKACADILKAAPRRATALKDACTLTLGLFLPFPFTERKLAITTISKQTQKQTN